MYKKILALILILFIAILLIYGKTLYQEGNPLPILYGILKLNFTNENIAQIPQNSNKYITRSKNGVDSVKQFMKEKDYTLVEQMGAGYEFTKSDGQTILITHRYYSKFYDIWNLSSQ